MSFLINNYRSALRLFSAIVNIDSRRLSVSQKYGFQTAVYGYDNKNPRSKYRVYPKWSYGDDACFIAKNDDCFVLGVSDGVGGWRSYGINPSKFSKAIMSQCEKAVKEGRMKVNKPLDLARTSLCDVCEQKTPIFGSATFCIISLCRNSGELYAANLGDSGYIIVRDSKLIAQSIQQKHSFNTPFQIALLPQISSGQNRYHQDNPEEATESSYQMKDGDFVVVGTDGLFENLPVSVIVNEVAIVQTQKSTPINQEILNGTAQKLVNQAHKNALASEFTSPFANEARSHGIHCKGGNPGDITVLLGYVVLQPESLHPVHRQQNQSEGFSPTKYNTCYSTIHDTHQTESQNFR